MKKNLQMIVESCVNQAFKNVLNEASDAMEVLDILNQSNLDSLSTGERMHTDTVDVDEENSVINLNDGTRIQYDVIDGNNVDFTIIGPEGEEIPVEDEEIRVRISHEILDIVEGEMDLDDIDSDDDIAGIDFDREDGPEHTRMEDGEGFISESRKRMLKENKMADLIISKFPDLIDKCVKRIMGLDSITDYNQACRMMYRYIDDLAYNLEQNYGLCRSWNETKAIAKEIMAQAEEVAREQGSKSHLLYTEKADKERKAREEEQTWQANHLDEFVEFLRNEGYEENESSPFESYMAYIGNLLFGNIERYRGVWKSRNIIIFVCERYDMFRGIRRNYNSWSIDAAWSRLDNSDIEIAKAVISHVKKEAKAAYLDYMKRREEKNNAGTQPVDTPEPSASEQESLMECARIKKNFFETFNKINGKKYF